MVKPRPSPKDQNPLTCNAADLPEHQKPEAIKYLLKHLELLEKGDEMELTMLGLDLRPGKQMVIKAALDHVHWQLSLMYRHSKPTKIGLAVKHLRWVLDHHDPRHVDPVPLYNLGVALMKSERGEEREVLEEADQHFEKAFNSADAETGLRSALWARAYYSRLLHKLGKEKQAKKQENILSSWYKGHITAMVPSEFADLVTDESDDPSTNPILLAVPNFGRKIHEFNHGTGQGMMIGDKSNGLLVMHGLQSIPTAGAEVVIRCGNCANPDPKNTCARCRSQKYCSRECQQKHWPTHKKSCNVTQ